MIISKITETTIRVAYHKGENETVHVFNNLVVQYETELLGKETELQGKETELQRLRDQLAKNSTNSSKPPSTDAFKKKQQAYAKQVFAQLAGKKATREQL